MTENKKGLILKVQELSGSTQLAQALMAKLLELLEPVFGVSGTATLAGKVSGGAARIVEATGVVYDALTEEELTAMVAYHESEHGKSATAKMPAIMQQAMEIGRQMGQALAEELFEEASERRESSLHRAVTGPLFIQNPADA